MKTWDEFDEKYSKTISAIARANQVGENEEADLGMARKMLTYMAENADGEKYDGVPEGFDWEGCRKDIADIMAQPKENR